MAFKDIIGQPQAVLQLQKAYQHARISHAYLFVGPSGVGKYQTARALAGLLLCEQPIDNDACGTCHSCQQMAAQSHMDMVEVVPDGAAIKVKQIRELRQRLATSSYYGGYTVVIIRDADTMNIESANALLKTIEEPQGPTCFILLATQAGRLPETILSRVQPIHFHKLTTAQLEQYVPHVKQLPQGELALFFADGSLTTLQTYLEDADLLTQRVQQRDALYNVLDHLTTMHEGALVRYAYSFQGARQERRNDVRALVLLVRYYYKKQLDTALSQGKAVEPLIPLFKMTTTALERLETNTDASSILAALLLELARYLRR